MAKKKLDGINLILQRARNALSRKSKPELQKLTKRFVNKQ